MVIITKACLGIFWLHLKKQDGRHRVFLNDSLERALHILQLFLIYGKLNHMVFLIDIYVLYSIHTFDLEACPYRSALDP